MSNAITLATLGPSYQAGGSALQGGAGNLQGTGSNSSGATLSVPGSAQSKVLGAGTTTPVATSPVTTPATGVSSPEYLQGLQKEYGSAISTGQNLIPFYQGAQAGQTGQVGQQYGNELNAENNNYGAQKNTYNTQEDVNNKGENLSLAELADQIHGQSQGLGIQLGTQGAGSSSAVGMGESALAKVQNTDRANIQQTAGGNDAVIEANKQQLLSQHNANLAALNDWKTQQLQSIVNYYTPLIASANQQIQAAQGEEERLAAVYNLQALNTGASTALNNLDSTVQNATKSATAATLAQLPKLQTEAAQPAPKAVSAPTLSPFNVVNAPTTGNTTAAPTGGSIAALMSNLQQNQTP